MSATIQYIQKTKITSSIDAKTEPHEGRNITAVNLHAQNDAQEKFLVKKVARCTDVHEGNPEENPLEEDEDMETRDDAALDSAEGASEADPEVSSWEYHILYNHSYGVPVLYFNAHWQDGRLWSLEDVWSSVPHHYQERLLHERWSFITQQEHPFLQRPFFQLHPCHTASLMDQVLGKCSPDSNYLLSWLSSVGPVVHLDIPLSYCTSAIK